MRFVIRHSMILTLLFNHAVCQATEILVIDDFSQPDMKNWQKENFAGETIYQAVMHQDKPALEANSSKSASGLVYRQNIDLDKTPWLNWEWNIPRTLPPHNERIRDGDDFVARIYVIYSKGWQFWNSRSLSYVWSSTEPADSHWPNPFTSQAHMWVVRSGNTDSNRWISEKRNIKQDFKRAFGQNIVNIQAVAIMSDTDNTNGSTLAYYGKIYFSAD